EPANSGFADRCLTTWLPRQRSRGSYRDPPASSRRFGLGPGHVRASEGARLERDGPVTTPKADRRHPVLSPTRGHLRVAWDVVFRALRFIARHAGNAYAVFGIFLLSGTAIAVAGTWAFSELAERVRKGSTQPFDDAIMQWVGAHQNPHIQAVMLE